VTGRTTIMGVAAFCSACGTPLTAGSGFCGSCGAPAPTALVAPGTSPVPAQPTHQTVTVGPSANPLACPRCMEVDQSAKVSSVVRKEVTSGTIGGSFVGGAYQFGKYGGPSIMGGGIHLSTQSLSALGQMLAPPAPPVYRSPWGAGPIIGILILGIAGYRSSGTDRACRWASYAWRWLQPSSSAACAPPRGARKPTSTRYHTGNAPRGAGTRCTCVSDATPSIRPDQAIFTAPNICNRSSTARSPRLAQQQWPGHARPLMAQLWSPLISGRSMVVRGIRRYLGATRAARTGAGIGRCGWTGDRRPEG